MIEILNIILSSFIIFLLFNTKRVFFLYNENQDIFKNININIIIFFNIALFFSFINNGVKFFSYFIFFICLLNLASFLKNIKNYLYISFIIINFVLFMKISSDPSLAWDGLGNWYPKVYNFFLGFSFFDLIETPRPSYPHLGAFIWSIGWYISILDYEYLGRFIYIFFYISSLFLIIYKNSDSDLKKFALFFILLIISFDINLFKGYQEYLIFSLFNIFIYFYYNEKNQKRLSILSLLIINSAVWFKDEGLIYSLPIVIMILLKKQKFLCLENLYFVSIYILILFFKFFMISKLLPFSELGGFSYEKVLNEIFNFSSFKMDFILIIYHFILSFFKYPIWMFVIIFLILPESKIKTNKIYKNSVLLFIYLFLINFMIFHLQDNKILEWQLSTALDRLNLIFSGYFVYFVYLNFRDYSSKYFLNEKSS